MPWTGSSPNKVYTRTDGVRTGSAVNVQADNANVNNTAALADARENDLADAINLTLTRDGSTQPSANLPMNTYAHTGVGAATARTMYARASQIQDGTLIYAEAGGTANAITLTTSPVCSPVEGMVIGFFAEADSSSTVTIDLNGTVDDLKYNAAALVGGEIQNGQFHYVAFDGTDWSLVNPYSLVYNSKLADIAALAVTDGNFIVGNGSTWVAESGSTARASLGLTDVLFANVTDTLTVGYNATEFDAGTKSSGTFTPDPTSGNFQKAVNNGAHTLAPPGSTCSIVIQYTNGASAGTVTTSGFTKVTGDSFTTTNGHDFMCYVIRNNSFSHLNVVALQ